MAWNNAWTKSPTPKGMVDVSNYLINYAISNLIIKEKLSADIFLKDIVDGLADEFLKAISNFSPENILHFIDVDDEPSPNNLASDELCDTIASFVYIRAQSSGHVKSCSLKKREDLSISLYINCVARGHVEKLTQQDYVEFFSSVNKSNTDEALKLLKVKQVLDA